MLKVKAMPLEIWLSWRLLIRRPRQTVLSVLGVAVGVVALIVMRSMTLGFLDEFTTKVIELVAHVTVLGEEWSAYLKEPADQTKAAVEPIRRALTPLPMPTLFTTTRPPMPKMRKGIANWEHVAAKIERLPEVVATAPVVGFEGLIVFGDRTELIELFGIDPIRQDRTVPFRDRIVSGSLTALRSNQNSIILGSKLAEELGVRLGDRVTVVGTDNKTATLRVVGFYSSKVAMVDRFRGFAPLRMAQRLRGTERVDAISVRLTNLKDADAVAQRITQMTGLDTQSWRAMSRSIMAIFVMIDVITTLVVGIIVLVSGFGIAITLLLLVSEKKGAIGIWKAAGMTSRRIAASFLTAGLLIAVVGITLGEMAGWLGIEILDRTPTGLSGWATFVEGETFPMLKRWDIYALGGGAALLVIVIASWFPAKRAASFDPVAILRGE